LANASGLSFGRATTIDGNVTVVSNVLSDGNGVTHSLGTLSIGAQTLTVNAGSHVTGTVAGLTFGAATLTDSATFAVGTNAQLTLGALSSNGDVATLTKTGAGTLLLGTAASSSNWVVGNNLVINQGVVQLNLASAVGSSAKTNVVVNATTAGTTAAFNLNNVNQSVLSLTFGGTGGTSTSTNNVSTGTGTLTLAEM